MNSEGHAAHGITPHESPVSMWLPLVLLAVLSVIGGYVGVSPALSSMVGIHSENHFEHFLEPSIGKASVAHGAESTGVAQAAGEASCACRDQHSGADRGGRSGSRGYDVSTERLFTGISVAIALLGLGIGWVVFTRNPLKTMPSILENKYYVTNSMMARSSNRSCPYREVFCGG